MPATFRIDGTDAVFDVEVRLPLTSVATVTIKPNGKTKIVPKGRGVILAAVKAVLKQKGT